MNEGKPTSGVKEVISIVLGVIGLPAGVASYVLGFADKNIWAIVGLVIAYYVVLIMLEVLGVLKAQWVKQFAEWIEWKRQLIFSRYYKKYCKNLEYQFRDFDVKGMSTQGTYTLSIQDVFVDLIISPSSMQELSANILEAKSDIDWDKPHSIWEFIKSSKGLRNNNIAIIGAPGSGKTTLLKHVALQLANRSKLVKKEKLSRLLPFVMFLREHVDAIINDREVSLLQIIEKQLDKWEMKFDKKWFEQKLNKGQMLIMFDGLDEVADSKQREAVSKWVESQMRNHGSNRFILSSRPHGYKSNPISGVTILEVKPFSQEQVKKFIHQWYLANEIMSSQKDDEGVHRKANKEASDLINRISNNASLGKLAVNPLLLTMIATIHRYKSSLPGRRVELYSEIIDVFLGNHQRAKGIALELTAEQKKCVLLPLAYELMGMNEREIKVEEAENIIKEPLQRVKPNISVAEFLKMVEESSGILIEREVGKYAFAHLTFQEFLASVYIIEQKMEEKLLAQINNSWWHEVIRLYVAKADATEIIRKCLENARASVSALVLCIECMEEAREVEPKLRDELNNLIEEGIDDKDPERREVVAEAMMAIRLKCMTRINEELYIDTKYITNAEYQLFIDEMRVKGKYYQPDHWTGYSFEEGKGKESIVGVRPSDAEAFCTWLAERGEGDWEYKVPECRKSEGVACDGNGSKYFVNTAKGFWASENGKSIFINESKTHLPSITLDMLDKQMRLDKENYSVRKWAFARALDRARVLDRALDRALDRDFDSALDRDLARDFDRALARARDFEGDHDFDFAVTLDFARALDLARTRDFEGDHDFDLAVTLDFALVLV